MKKSIFYFFYAATLFLVTIGCGKENLNVSQNDDTQYDSVVNQAPLAIISPIKTVYVEQKDCQIQFSQDIILDATQSSDPANGKLHFKWDLGHGPIYNYVSLEPINPDSSKVRVVIRQLFAEQNLYVHLTVSNARGQKNSAFGYVKIEQKEPGQSDFTLKANHFMGSYTNDYSWHKFTGNNYWIFQRHNELSFVNPSNKSITPNTKPKNLFGYSVVELNEKLFLIGGGTETNNSWNNVPEKSVYIFDKTLDKWSAAASLNIQRSNSMAYSLGEKIIVGGGWNYAQNGSEFGDPVSSIELYDPAVNKWTDISPPGLPLSGYALVVNNGKAYVVGGSNSNYYYIDQYTYLDPFTIFSDRLFIYDEVMGQWSQSKLPDSLANVTGVASGPYIFLSGVIKQRGLRNTKKAMILDTRNNSIVQHCLSATLGISSHILPAGDKILFLTLNSTSLQNASIDAYNTQTGQWSVGNLDKNTGMALMDNKFLQFWSYQDKVYTTDGQQIWQLDF